MINNLCFNQYDRVATTWYPKYLKGSVGIGSQHFGKNVWDFCKKFFFIFFPSISMLLKSMYISKLEKVESLRTSICMIQDMLSQNVLHLAHRILSNIWTLNLSFLKHFDDYILQGGKLLKCISMTHLYIFPKKDKF